MQIIYLMHFQRVFDPHEILSVSSVRLLSRETDLKVIAKDVSKNAGRFMIEK